jgi:hypothetical protein
MPSVETICRRQWEDPDFRRKWLIGGVIATIPLVNLLFAGWMLRYARSLRQGGSLALPDWEQWDQLLFDGLRMTALKVIFLGVPVLVMCGISWVLQYFFSLLALDFFARTIAWAPVTFGVLVGIVLWMSAVHVFLKREEWRDLLDLSKVLRAATRSVVDLIFPTCALLGLLAVGWPFLGFAFLLGLMPFVAYSTAVFHQSNQRVSN